MLEVRRVKILSDMAVAADNQTASEDTELTLFIKPLTGSTITLRLLFTDTIGDLIQRIGERTGIPRDQIRLAWWVTAAHTA
jgi:hypothetical protein